MVVHNGLKTDLSNKHCYGGHEQNHIDLAGRGIEDVEEDEDKRDACECPASQCISIVAGKSSKVVTRMQTS